jgi:hypothetical protein
LPPRNNLKAALMPTFQEPICRALCLCKVGTYDRRDDK